jgi:glycosyltransferase involved in cell wall biosynthesis
VRSNLATLKGVRGKDVLYVPGISAASGSLLAALYCRVTGRRVIHHFHDLGTSNRLFPLWVPLVTDFVHNTEFGFRAIAKKLPAVRSKRNFIVPSIVEVDERLPDTPNVSREFLEWRNIFYVGQISRHKGVDLLIGAFIAVAAKYPDVKLHLVGEGTQEFLAELQREVEAAGLEGRVKILGISGGCDAAAALRLRLRSKQSSQQGSRIFRAQRGGGDGPRCSHRVLSERRTAGGRVARKDRVDLRRNFRTTGGSYGPVFARRWVPQRLRRERL